MGSVIRIGSRESRLAVCRQKLSDEKLKDYIRK